jgi:hypothetical protein
VRYGKDPVGCTAGVHEGDNEIITVDDQSPNDKLTV